MGRGIRLSTLFPNQVLKSIVTHTYGSLLATCAVYWQFGQPFCVAILDVNHYQNSQKLLPMALSDGQAETESRLFDQ